MSTQLEAITKNLKGLQMGNQQPQLGPSGSGH